MMTPQDRLDEVVKFDRDPSEVRLKPVFDTDGSVKAYTDSGTGKLIGFKNFRTGEYMTRAPTFNEDLAEGAVRALPSPLQGIGRSIQDASPAEIARFGVETAAANWAGAGLAAATKAVPYLGRGARVGAPIVGEGVGAAVGSLGSETFDPTPAPFTRATELGASSVVGAALGSHIAGFLGKMRRGGSGLTPDATEVVATMDSLGVPLPTAGRLSTSRTLDITETMTEGSFTGGGAMSARNESSQAGMQAAIDDSVNALTRGSNRVDLEETLVNTINDRADVWRETASSLYGQLDGLGATGGVDVTDAVVRALEIERRNALGNTSPEVSRVTEALLKHYRNAVEVHGYDLEAGDRLRIPWETAAILRSNYLGIGRVAGEMIAGEGQSAARPLAGIIDDAMDVAAHDLDPALRDTWRAANEHWREGADVFNSMFIKSLANSEPDFVFQKAIARNRPDRIRRLREIILDTSRAPRTATRQEGTRPYPNSAPHPNAPSIHRTVRTLEQADAEVVRLRGVAQRTRNPRIAAEYTARANTLETGANAWRGIQGAFLQDVLTKSVRQADVLSPLPVGPQRFVPRRSATTIRAKMDAYGDEALREIFPDTAQRQNFDRLVRALDASQREAGKNIPGRIAIQLNQAGGLFALVTGNPGLGAIMLGTPAVASRVLTDERFIRHMLLANRTDVMGMRDKGARWAGAAALAIAQGAAYSGDDPKLLKLQAERDQNYGPGSPRPGSKTPTPTRTATP